MSLEDLTSTSPPAQIKGTTTKKPKRSLAWLLPVALLLGFVIIIATLFGERMLPATEVRTAPVITIRAGESLAKEPKTDISVKGKLLFQASGWVEPDPYTISVPTLTNGVVKEVYALEGQSVKAGDLVATLIPDDAQLDHDAAERKFSTQGARIAAHCASYPLIQAEITAAERKVEALQAQLEQARDRSSRLDRLKKGSVSEQEIIRARLGVLRDNALLEEAKSEITRLNAKLSQNKLEKEMMTAVLFEIATEFDRAKLALDRTKISSPVDGTVLRLHAAPGMKRMLNMDSPTSAVIVELYDPEKLQARIDVPLNEASVLSVGQSVDIVSDILPDKTFTGTVTRISGQADLQRNTLQAKVHINSPDPRLRPDMLVRAKFFDTETTQTSGETSSGRLSIYVPENALIGESTVWVVSPDSTAEKRTIKLGTETKDAHRLVLEGLRSGESVILPPHESLSEGTRIKTTTSK
ncbi:efflux RND transporter periplasmic adaptor subunit [Luteolibacter sp. AS25]|uniref:efflux RND transporter periplasmic adaptor subunit n=1 Tax=Luteolibacter sp. AS25 TaxID=3135776 RepID=UPI00398B2874